MSAKSRGFLTPSLSIPEEKVCNPVYGSIHVQTRFQHTHTQGHPLLQLLADGGVDGQVGEAGVQVEVVLSGGGTEQQQQYLQ